MFHHIGELTRPMHAVSLARKHYTKNIIPFTSILPFKKCKVHDYSPYYYWDLNYLNLLNEVIYIIV